MHNLFNLNEGSVFRDTEIFTINQQLNTHNGLKKQVEIGEQMAGIETIQFPATWRVCNHLINPKDAEDHIYDYGAVYFWKGYVLCDECYQGATESSDGFEMVRLASTPSSDEQILYKTLPAILKGNFEIQREHGLIGVTDFRWDEPKPYGEYCEDLYIDSMLRTHYLGGNPIVMFDTFCSCESCLENWNRIMESEDEWREIENTRTIDHDGVNKLFREKIIPLNHELIFKKGL